MSVVTAPLERVQHWIGSLPERVAPRRVETRDGRNRAATASYLFGILSPLPLLGLLFGVAAVVEGARGLRYAQEHPDGEGALRCRIGMALGALFASVYLVASLFLLSILI